MPAVSRLEEMRDNRQPFTLDYTLCPACGCGGNGHGREVAYTEESGMRDHDGQLSVTVTTLGAKPDWHLVLTCKTCGFQFERECADAFTD